MKTETVRAFDVKFENAITTVTFGFGSVSVQGQDMLSDPNSLAMRLERDRDTKVVVFQSANPEIRVCHDDSGLLKDMSTEAVSRDDARLCTINKAQQPDEVGPCVDAPAQCIAQFPPVSVKRAEPINTCRQMPCEPIDRPTADAVRAEAHWLYESYQKNVGDQTLNARRRAGPRTRYRKSTHPERACREGPGIRWLSAAERRLLRR